MMPSYMKICVICQVSFSCSRIDRLYCSPTCKNRTRYMPLELLNTLKKRNEQFMIKANNFAASVSNQDGRIVTMGKEIEGATKEHPLGKDEGLLIGHAILMREERDAKIRNKQKEESKSNGFNNNNDNLDNTSSEYVLNKKRGVTLTFKDSNKTPPSSMNSNIGFVRINGEDVPIDPEMKDFVLEDDDTPNLSSTVTITTENDLTLSSIQKCVNEMNKEPTKSKIHRIGEKHA